MTKVERHSPDDHRSRFPDIGGPFCLLLILSAGFLLRTQEIVAVSCTFDEASSWKTIQFSWNQMFESISRNVHPPVFYILLKGWANVFGDSSVALRMFSVFFGMMTIAIVIVFMRQATTGTSGRHATWCSPEAIVAATLISLNPIHVELSLQARMYTLATFLAVVAATFLLRIMASGGTIWDWTGYTVAGVMLTLSHYYGLFTAASFVLLLIARIIQEAAVSGTTSTLKRLLVGSFICSWTAAFVWRAWLPVFLSQRSQVAADYWVPEFKWGQLSSLWEELLTGHATGVFDNIPAWSCFAVACVVVLVALLYGGVAGRISGVAVFVPVVAAVAISLTGQSILVWRYLLLSQTFLLLALAVLLNKVPSRATGYLVIGLTAAWFSYWSCGYWAKRQMEAEQLSLRNAAAVLNEWHEDGEPVIVTAPECCIVMQRYAETPEDVFADDLGYEYRHYEGGPVLQASEYKDIASLWNQQMDRVFLVSPRNYRDDLGPGWREVRSRTFFGSVNGSQDATIYEFVRIGAF